MTQRQEQMLDLLEETCPVTTRDRPFSIRIQYKSRIHSKPFADIELIHPSDLVTREAASLFLRMMKELSNGMAIED